MKTKNGIYNDLNESTYKMELLGVTFYFSSEFYLNKFKNNVINFINQEKEKLFTRYGVNLFIDGINLFFAISYYRKVEKRGIRIIDKGGNKFKDLLKV